MTGPTWEQFSRQLALDLNRLAASDVVVLGEKNRAVFFAQNPDHLMIEVAGNEVLTGDDRLAPEQEQQLAADGWQPNGPERTWWFRLPFPATSAQAAQASELICRALRLLGNADLATMRYDAWSYADDTNITPTALRELTRRRVS